MTSRRRFLVQAGAGVGVMGLPLRAHPASGGRNVHLPDARLERTLAAVLQHLFPDEPDAPGAGDVNAVTWIRYVLQDTLIPESERQFLADGLVLFTKRLAEAHDRPFWALDTPRREAVLRDFENTHIGRAWLRQLLVYTLEACLTDPIHGGNPQGIGWRWLEHRPGFPRPPAHKRRYPP